MPVPFEALSLWILSSISVSNSVEIISIPLFFSPVIIGKVTYVFL
jgi:hypothetical protein